MFSLNTGYFTCRHKMDTDYSIVTKTYSRALNLLVIAGVQLTDSEAALYTKVQRGSRFRVDGPAFSQWESVSDMEDDTLLWAGLCDALQHAAREVIKNDSCWAWSVDLLSGNISQGLFIRESKKQQEISKRIDLSDTNLPIKSLRLPDDILINPTTGLLTDYWYEKPEYSSLPMLLGSTYISTNTRSFEVSWSGQELSRDMVKRKGILEGLERYSNCIPSNELQIAHFAAQNHKDCLRPDDAGKFHLSPSAYQFVPFENQEEIDWIKAIDIIDFKECWVPEELVFFGESGKHVWSRNSSSGGAVGRTLGSASLSGLLEVLERDAFLCCWYTDQNTYKIDYTSMQKVCALLPRVLACRAELSLSLIPTDFPIYVVVASVRGREWVSIGASARFSIEDASLAAAKEAVAFYPDRVENGRNNQRWKELQNYESIKTLEDHSAMLHLPEWTDRLSKILGWNMPYCDFRKYDEISMLSLDEDIQNLLESLKSRNVSVVVCETTPYWLRALDLVSSVVIAPGLAPLDFGWSNQRILNMTRPFEYYNNIGNEGTANIKKIPHPLS